MENAQRSGRCRLTFKPPRSSADAYQASELGGQVHKGEHGSLVVYADRITRTETADNGEETEHSIPFLKGYTVFNCEQIDSLPGHFTAPAEPALDPLARIVSAEVFCRNTGADIRFGGDRAYYAVDADYVQMPPFETFCDAEAFMQPLDIRLATGLVIPPNWIGNSAASAGATKATPPRSLSLNSVARSSPPTSASRPSRARIRPPISTPG